MHAIWVARNKNGLLRLFNEKPWRVRDFWNANKQYPLDRDLFNNLKWEDEPIKIDNPDLDELMFKYGLL